MKRSGYQMYSDSKLMLYMFGVELQKRLRASGSSTDIFSAHPGVAQTDAFRKSDKSKIMARVLASGADLIGQSAGGGAQSLMKCATDPSLTGQPYDAVLASKGLQCSNGQLMVSALGLCPDYQSPHERSCVHLVHMYTRAAYTPPMACRDGRWGQALGMLVYRHSSKALWSNSAFMLHP